VNFVPVHCDSSNGFQVTVPALEAAYERAAAAGMRVAGVLLTNPSNLLGTTVTRSVLEDVLDLVARKNIHIISDEIYSSSVFAAPDLVSVAELVESRARRGGDPGIARRVHVVYSLSKDLGLPGFRVGVVYSYNDAVVATARRMSSFTLVSSQTQKTLDTMLADEYIRTNRNRLRERHDQRPRGGRPGQGRRAVPAQQRRAVSVDGYAGAPPRGHRRRRAQAVGPDAARGEA
jgi:1-aminocyclopropane-1-carboxylate synthase